MILRRDSFKSGRLAGNLRAEEFDGVILPGGVANPDQLGLDAPTLIPRGFLRCEKARCVICHGPWTLVEPTLYGAAR